MPFFRFAQAFATEVLFNVMSGMVMNHGAEVCESNVVIRVAPAAWMTKTGQKAVDLVVQDGATLVCLLPKLA